MAMDRELLKKELSYILQLNAKTRYESQKNVQTMHDMVVQKNLFQTTLGQKYVSRLAARASGHDASTQCVLCKNTLDNPGLVCGHCLIKYAPVSAGKQESRGQGETAAARGGEQQLADISRQTVTTLKGGLDTLTSKINAMAGESGSVDLRLRDLFSGVFKKHTREESEEIFIAGTLKTTPAETDIAVSWPKPWLFSRVLLVLLAAFALLYVCVAQFGNPNAIPGLMFLGALAIPFSVLIFIFETNAPRNISIFEVTKMFFVGGTASLVLTLFLFEIFPSRELDYIGALIVGVVEELGKLLAILIFVKLLNPKYILNGMLIGASIGAGFAVFETAGYAFRYYLMSSGNISALTDILFLRGWSSLGGHVAWAAIIGAGLVMVKGESPLSGQMLFHVKFQTFFFLPVILHAVWDCPLLAKEFVLKLIALIAIAWIILLVLLNVGLKQIERLCKSADSFQQ